MAGIKGAHNRTKKGTFQKGHVRFGGRVKGTLNKATINLRELAEKLGVNPFEILLHFASGNWKALGYDSSTRIASFTQSGDPIYDDVIKPADRLKAAAEAVSYLEPKRKAVEHSGPDGGPIETRDLSNLSDDEIKSRVDQLLSKRGPK